MKIKSEAGSGTYETIWRNNEGKKASGTIEEVEEPEAPGKHYYIPHHPIIWDDHTTTKLRIVFDASTKS